MRQEGEAGIAQTMGITITTIWKCPEKERNYLCAEQLTQHTQWISHGKQLMIEALSIPIHHSNKTLCPEVKKLYHKKQNISKNRSLL